MKIRFAAALLFSGIFAIQGQVHAAETSVNPAVVSEGYILAAKGHQPLPGTRIKIELSSSLLNGKKTFNAKGRSLEADTTQEVRQVWQTEQLKKDNLRHTVLTKSVEGKTTANGRSKPLMVRPPLLRDVPLMVTRVDGKWVARIENGAGHGEEFAEDAREELESVSEIYNVDSSFPIYGETPRKPGDRWVVEGSKLPSFAGVVAPDGQVEIHFSEVNDYQGAKCAVLNLKFSLRGKAPADQGGYRMAVEGTGTVHRSITDSVDLLTEMKGKMNVSSNDDPVPPIKITGTLELKITTTVQKP